MSVLREIGLYIAIWSTICTVMLAGAGVAELIHRWRRRKREGKAA
jgi:hypothetical protein